MKRLFKSLLSLCLCFACSVGTFITALADEPVIEIEPVGREILTRTNTVEDYDSNYAHFTFTVKYTTRDDSSNPTGKYITGVLSISPSYTKGAWSKISGFTYTYSYGSNHGSLNITYSYWGTDSYNNSTYCTRTATLLP